MGQTGRNLIHNGTEAAARIFMALLSLMHFPFQDLLDVAAQKHCIDSLVDPGA